MILAVYAGLRGRRWLARRRAGPRPAEEELIAELSAAATAPRDPLR